MSLRATIAHRAWLAAGIPAHHAFRRALRRPREVQEEILRRYLRQNAATRFGHRHGFAAMRSLADYQAGVPPRDYDGLRTDIEAIASGERGVLTRQRVLRLEPTGGSAGGSKWIPYTAQLQREFGRAIAPWVADLFRDRPALLSGSAYWSITPIVPATADRRPGVPLGFEEDSAYLGGGLKAVVDATLAVPGAVRRIGDPTRFRRVTLLHLLRARDLALVSVWHPSFLTLLLEDLEETWDELLATLARGSVTGIPALDLPPAPGLARELAVLGPRPATRVWPRLALVSCWGDAAAAAHLAGLRRLLPGVELQPKGLIATEAFVSLPYAGLHPLALTSHFFEFEDAGGHAHPAWALEEGSNYTLLVTTGGGLYRYRLRDRVKITGFLERGPCLRFLGKEDRISDQRGEKLDEAFVTGVVQRLLADHALAADFALLAPESSGDRVGYVLFIATERPLPPTLATALEEALCANPQYAYAVRLGQLAPATTCSVEPGASRRYLERLQAGGARLGDIKPAALSPLDGWREILRQDELRGGRQTRAV